MARALYIHWPFCLAKCPYCDFNSHVRDSVDVAQWQAALLADMRAEAELAGGQKADGALTSIFFGGGTPSLMPPALVAKLLEEAQTLWGFAPDIEITLEANPSSVEAGNFAALAAAGVNRVSLGLQAMDDETLQFLGRLHDAREGLKALETAQKAFERVSFDLIYALPEQTGKQWRGQLSRALSFGTGHLSLYQLTIEPGTRFATDVRQGGFAPLDDDLAAYLYTVTIEMTEAAGLPAYEISNYARLGEESRHNLTYWRYQDYAGIGPGAHGRRGGMATLRHKKPENWLSAVERNGHGTKEERGLNPSDQACEALLMGLRLTEGINLVDLSRRFGIAQEKLLVPRMLSQFADLGVIWRAGARVGVTKKGMALLDAVLAGVVSDDLLLA